MSTEERTNHEQLKSFARTSLLSTICCVKATISTLCSVVLHCHGPFTTGRNDRAIITFMNEIRYTTRWSLRSLSFFSQVHYIAVVVLIFRNNVLCFDNQHQYYRITYRNVCSVTHSDANLTSYNIYKHAVAPFTEISFWKQYRIHALC